MNTSILMLCEGFIGLPLRRAPQPLFGLWLHEAMAQEVRMLQAKASMEYLEISWNIWRYLGISGDILGYLEFWISWNIWRFVGAHCSFRNTTGWPATEHLPDFFDGEHLRRTFHRSLGDPTPASHKMWKARTGDEK